MRMQSSSSPVEMSHSLGSSSFSIAMNAKAFRTLSDSLYQNKIGSIVREICCNAVDGHIAKGNPEIPFEVHLPDNFEPWFSVRDFGIGLSPDDIVTVFSRYFESTKDQSDDMIGAFGLGAKSPFSYVDQFTVTSITDGISRAYSAYIGEDGLPRIDLMAEFPTDESTGVEVKIGANFKDYEKFASELKNQLRWFPVKPIVSNNSNFAWHNDIREDIIYEDDNILISNEHPGYYDTAAFIVQGNVGYPLDVSNLGDGVNPDNLNLITSLRTNIVLFKFDIGQIGVTASREAIEYNKYTINNIDESLTKVRKALNEFVKEKVAEYDTDWDRVKFLNQHVLLRQIATASGIQFDSDTVYKGHNSYGFNFQSVMLAKDAKGVEVGIGRVTGYTRKQKSTTIFPNNQNIVIIVRDTSNRPMMRLKYYVQKNNIAEDNVYEIVLHNRSRANAQFVQRVKDALGGFDNVILSSSIDLPKAVIESQKRSGTTYTRPKYYSMSNGISDYIRGWEKEYTNIKDIEDDTIYVEIENMEAQVKYNVQFGPKTLDPFYALQCLVKTGIDLPEVIGIRTADLKRIAGKDNFIEVSDFVQSELDKIDVKAARIHMKHNFIRSSVAGFFHKMHPIAENIDDQNNILVRISNFAHKDVDNENHGKVIRDLLGSYYCDVNQTLKEIQRNIFDKYPVLKVLDMYYSPVSDEELAEYINMVDKQRA